MIGLKRAELVQGDSILGLLLRHLARKLSFAWGFKLVGKMPGAAGGHLETIWDSLMENGINPRENGAKKWTDPL